MSGHLEDLKQMLKDDKDNLSLGEVRGLQLARDRSVLDVTVSVFPEDREIVASMSWEAVGKDAGFYHFPNIGDVVLIAYPDQEIDNAVIIKRFSNIDDTIPQNAVGGDMVLKTREGETLWITGQKRINRSQTCLLYTSPSPRD